MQCLGRNWSFSSSAIDADMEERRFLPPTTTFLGVRDRTRLICPQVLTNRPTGMLSTAASSCMHLLMQWWFGWGRCASWIQPYLGVFTVDNVQFCRLSWQYSAGLDLAGKPPTLTTFAQKTSLILKQWVEKGSVFNTGPCDGLTHKSSSFSTKQHRGYIW